MKRTRMREKIKPDRNDNCETKVMNFLLSVINDKSKKSDYDENKIIKILEYLKHKDKMLSDAVYPHLCTKL